MIMKTRIVFAVLLFGLISAGCAIYEVRTADFNSDWLAVRIDNFSPYRVELAGAVDGVLGPKGERSSVQVNMKCRGQFEVIAKAHKEIGRASNGTAVYAYMGQAKFFLSLDGRNFMYNQESLDEYYALGESSFSLSLC